MTTAADENGELIEELELLLHYRDMNQGSREQLRLIARQWAKDFPRPIVGSQEWLDDLAQRRGVADVVVIRDAASVERRRHLKVVQ